MNRSQSKIRHIKQSNVLLEHRRFGLLEDQQKTSMVFMGSTPSSDNKWDAGEGFFNVARRSDGIVSSVTNFHSAGNEPSKENDLTMAEQLGIPGNGGDMSNSVAFKYVTKVKAGDYLNLTFNANSSNGGNVTSETYSTRGPIQSDTIYGGRFTLMNLPENSTITIFAKGDNVNKLVIKTTKK
jgi:hypothetical protein